MSVSIQTKKCSSIMSCLSFAIACTLFEWLLSNMNQRNNNKICKPQFICTCDDYIPALCCIILLALSTGEKEILKQSTRMLWRGWQYTTVCIWGRFAIITECRFEWLILPFNIWVEWTHLDMTVGPVFLQQFSHAVRVGILWNWGLTPPPSSCLQMLIYEWKSSINFNPWAKFQTFRKLTPQFF